MQESLQTILLGVSQSAILDHGDFNQAAAFIARAAQEGLGVARCSVWFLAEGFEELRCVLLIDTAHTSVEPELTLTASSFPAYFQALQHERTIVADNALADPATAEFGDCYLKPLGISSMLDAPIRHRGAMVGILCSEHVGPARVWSASEKAFVGGLADLLGRALEARYRHEAEEALRVTNLQLEDKVQERTRELATALDALKHTQSQLIEREKMAALGNLVAGIAHEVNTPLGIAIMGITHLQGELSKLKVRYESGELTEADLQSYIRQGEEAGDLLTTNLSRAANLIRSFKQTAVHQSTEELQEFCLHDIIESLLVSMYPETKRKHLSFDLQCPNDLVLRSYADTYIQILTNLIMNSLRHGYPDQDVGRIVIHCAKINEDHLQLLFRDDGCGIAAQYRSRIFEPFFTTKKNAEGSGLGLHIVYQLVTKRLNGRIDLVDQELPGAAFRIECPLRL